MAFLRLNGITIPVATGAAELDYENIGSRDRAFDGTMITDRRASKRKWKLSTKPLDEVEAKAVEGLIRGEGHVFHYNDGASTYSSYSKVDQFSSKGLGPSTELSPDSGHFRFGAGQDGALVYDTSDVTESLFASTGALESAPAATNLCSQNQSDGTDTLGDTTGFDVNGSATISTSTTQKLQGSRSLKVATTGSASDGMRVDDVSISSSTQYVATVHVYTDATEDFTIRAIGDVSGVLSSETQVTLTAGRWYRWTIVFTTGGSESTVDIQVIVHNAHTNLNFYVDGCQVESGSRVTPWKQSASARTNGNLDYGTAFNSYQAFTINFWTKAPATIPSSIEHMIAATNSAQNNLVLLSHMNSTGNVRFFMSLNSVNINVSGTPFDDTWHMVTATLAQFADGSTYNKAQLYVDGASVGTDNTLSGTFDPSTITAFDVGNRLGSGGHYAGTIEDLTILPYALTPTQVAAIYTMGNTDSEPMSDLPKLKMDGDIVPDPDYGVEVMGRVTSVDYAQRGSVSAWENNKRIITFELQEV